MGKWSDFFAMTKHERAGAIVVLVIILLAVLAIWIIPRVSKESTPPMSRQDVERFLVETDTALVTVQRSSSTSKSRRDSTRRKKERTSSSRSGTKSGKPAAKPQGGNNAPLNDIVPNED